MTKPKNHQDIQELFRKYIFRVISSEEWGILLQFFATASVEDFNEVMEIFFQELEDDPRPVSSSERIVMHRLDTYIKNQLRVSVDPLGYKQKIDYVFWRWGIAVMLLFFLGWIIARWAVVSSLDEMDNQTLVWPSNTNVDNNNLAILSLSDGRTIILKNNRTDIPISANLHFYTFRTEFLEQAIPTALNTLRVPRGGHYRIRLSDGTRVWLNASSILRYPSFFASDIRQVELEGEAYFEVSPNTEVSFLVISRYQKVEVMGTRFIVNSYPDEKYDKSILLEGKGKVFLHNSKQFALLNPGKEAIVTSDNLLIVSTDMEAAIAWRNNDFIFRDQNLQSIMRQIARWYDVNVKYAIDVPLALYIGGSISRTKSLTAVLKTIESTNSIHFEFDGKTIIVSKKS